MIAAARDEFSQLLARLEEELGDREFFCGAMSIADLAANLLCAGCGLRCESR